MSSGLGMILATAGILAYDFYIRRFPRELPALIGAVMPQDPKSHRRNP